MNDAWKNRCWILDAGYSIPLRPIFHPVSRIQDQVSVMNEWNTDQLVAWDPPSPTSLRMKLRRVERLWRGFAAWRK
jgi:hypothetical protein